MTDQRIEKTDIIPIRTKYEGVRLISNQGDTFENIPLRFVTRLRAFHTANMVLMHHIDNIAANLDVRSDPAGIRSLNTILMCLASIAESVAR